MSKSSTYALIDTLGDSFDNEVLKWRDSLIPESHEVYIHNFHVYYTVLFRLKLVQLIMWNKVIMIKKVSGIKLMRYIYILMIISTSVMYRINLL